MRKLEIAWERAKIIPEWREWADRIAKAAGKILEDNLYGVYLFGSIIKGEYAAASDIDILTVSKSLPHSLLQRSSLTLTIADTAGLHELHPFEIHLVDLTWRRPKYTSDAQVMVSPE